ncbi:TetR/AcrR family transcriptional regulator [Tessaracoccus palaemonis]|uniref:TetR/AcrR family transcriptional regulator n=1 Tax=Tessaracoccus palaemonis TaxID=2829499 RepID=UPI0021034836|nr:TetR/AcrR family transcriptional regulator [Tessaracoccus palaemonis]
MPPSKRARNRGPAAAPANRAALLKAARRLFSRDGYHVALSAIAREAGVGQGVLYRHFPRRFDLALAVFEENFVALEELAASADGPGAFGDLFSLLVDFTIDSTAFIDMVLDAQTEYPSDIGLERLSALIGEPLARAREAGLADPTWTVGDVVLVIHMLHGVAQAQTDPADVPVAVGRALALIDGRLLQANGEVAAEPPLSASEVGRGDGGPAAD